MNYPKISIVTPSFNQAEFLEETICSVLDQGYPNLQYVIVDGGSKDGSVEIIKKYEKYLWRWTSEPDRGHGNALNKGFANTSGEIMAWLNSDDKYISGALFTVAEIFMQFNDVQWLMGKNGWWDKQGQFVGEKYVYKNIYDFLTGDYAWIQQESIFWHRKLWQLAGGYINENYKFMVDGELWTRFFLVTDLWHVDQVLSGYRSHGTNRAKLNMDAIKEEMEKAIAILLDKIDPHVKENITKFTTEQVYLEDISLNYNVLKCNNDHWVKKKINYFAVKLKERFFYYASNSRERDEKLDLDLFELIDRRLFIWGTGSTAQNYYDRVCSNGNSQRIAGFIDSNSSKWDSSFNGKKIYSLNDVLNMYDKLAILVGSMYYNEIGKQLVEAGFSRYNDYLYYY